MALSGKTSNKFYLTSGGGADEINGTRKTALDAFNTADAAAGYKQLIDNNTLGPLIVNLQEMQDDIDELRRFVVSASELKGAIGTLPIAGGGTGSTSTTYCDLTANVTGALPNANVAADLTITAGTIENTPIGASTANTIVGTTIDASTNFTIGTTVITDDQIRFTPTTSDIVAIAAAANGVLNITTSDASGSKQANITISAEGTAEIAAASTITLDTSLDIELEPGSVNKYVNNVGIFRGGNIGPISDTFIPVMPVDFNNTDDSRSHPILGGDGKMMVPVNDRATYYCQKIIPKGYTATAAVIKGLDTGGAGAIIAYVTDLDGTTPSAVSASVTFSSGAWTIPFGVASIVGDGEKICTLSFDPGSTSNRIYGGKITIAKT